MKLACCLMVGVLSGCVAAGPDGSGGNGPTVSGYIDTSARKGL